MKAEMKIDDLLFELDQLHLKHSRRSDEIETYVKSEFFKAKDLAGNDINESAKKYARKSVDDRKAASNFIDRIFTNFNSVYDSTHSSILKQFTDEYDLFFNNDKFGSVSRNMIVFDFEDEFSPTHYFTDWDKYYNLSFKLYEYRCLTCSIGEMADKIRKSINANCHTTRDTVLLNDDEYSKVFNIWQK